jgi:hypothetical protein
MVKYKFFEPAVVAVYLVYTELTLERKFSFLHSNKKKYAGLEKKICSYTYVTKYCIPSKKKIQQTTNFY